MALHESQEMYIETIYRLIQKKGHVRSIDVAEEMGYSKPSVSRAVNRLKQENYLLVQDNGCLVLTDAGVQLARKVYERHIVLSDLLRSLGVDEATAARDACRIEHVISDESFAAVKRYIENTKQN